MNIRMSNSTIMKILLPVLMLLSFCNAAEGRHERYPEFALSNIPDSLLSNADAVIRKDSCVITCNGMKGYRTFHFKAITILNKRAEELGIYLNSTNKYNQLDMFSSKVLDKDGNVLKKYSKNDLNSTQASQSFFDDITTIYLEHGNTEFPYTVMIEDEESKTNGFLAFNTWYLNNLSGVSIEKGFFAIKTPAGFKYNYKVDNAECHESVFEEKGFITRTFSFASLKAPIEESYKLPFTKRIPIIYASPVDFEYYNVKGNASDWENYGKWQFNFLQGINRIPNELSEKIHRLTDGLPSNLEKIRAIYKYMGETTRYVSIQIGKGGFKPMSAEDVYKNGYGDCKALSNYFISMLSVIGVEAHYVEIGTDCIDFPCSFATPMSTNHAIVKIPSQETTDYKEFWVECTNKDNPFGYVHSDIAGHDALVYYSNSAKVEKLPKIADSLNMNESFITIDFSDNDSTRIQVAETYSGITAEGMSEYLKMAKSEIDKSIKYMVSLPLARIHDLNMTMNEDCQIPIFHINYNISVPSYGSKSKNRRFLPISPFGLESNKSIKHRETPIFIENGNLRVEKISIKIPDGYEYEGERTFTNELSNEFGSIQTTVSAGEKSIEISMKKLTRSGLFKPESYIDLKKFHDAIRKQGRKKIVLKQIEN